MAFVGVMSVHEPITNQPVASTHGIRRVNLYSYRVIHRIELGVQGTSTVYPRSSGLP